MKILVAVKRVIDPYVKIRVNAQGDDIEKQNVKMSMNPFDEIALEEALRLKEQAIASEIILVSIGDHSVPETLRHGLALGADRAIFIQSEQHLSPLAIAKLLKVTAENNQVQLIIMGKQAIDDDCNQTGQMLAALLNWPQATFASKILIENNQATVQRELDSGLQTLKVQLPAVITTDLRLNTPRFAKLPDIMKAKTKPLETLTQQSFGLDLSSNLIQKNIAAPAPRQAGIKVANVEELLIKLREITPIIR